MKNVKNLSERRNIMKDNVKMFHVEEPQSIENEAEFFIQSSAPCTVACSAHIHNAIELLYIKDGSYNVSVDGREYEVAQGDLILFCSNSIHYVSAESSPVNEYYVIKIPPLFLFEFSQHKVKAEYIMRFALNRDGQKTVWKKDELKHGNILPILERLVSEHEEQKYASEVAIRLKIMELLLEILRESNGYADLMSDQAAEAIYNAMLYAKNNYPEDMDERKLAKSVGMSYSYFTRSFKRIAGMTFRKYLNIIRIHAAEQQLCMSDESVTEIAIKCGYNSTPYFINVFRSITGKTPYQMRRQLKARKIE